ncbi:biotin carboxylase N-terminal domain-containing protein [Actinotalea sp. AC32]|nr:biotin carboxylase N-terminal domain-containing protein [Actinotalea sp. AC32]
MTTAPLFGTVLVANRGEIACRVIRTLRRLGIRSVAVHSDADADAAHVRAADVAVRIGPAAAEHSYLDVDAVVDAALRTGADVVHPGYGFLAESPALALACGRAGVVLVGPGLRALEVMGDKIRARTHVAAAGVPVLPGTERPGMTDDELVDAATAVGFPLLVKPSAGGGGKGMEVVRRPADLPAALVAARRVARAAFGDDDLLLERFVERPRHVEVQVLGDVHGTVVHLGERECSLQRRHQKVVEEAPSPLLGPEDRERLGELACTVARSVGYVGAGTVELLVADDDPTQAWFMEMNTRLQVEHPVTELVTGVDLVECQLVVAAGRPVPVAQDDVRLVGHAVEARLYAEDPARGFLPTTGTVLALAEAAGDGVRVDSGLREGLVVGAHYDPMLAKVVAWGSDRAQALDRLDAALAATTVLGVRTNLEVLRALVGDADVRAGRLDTGLVERRLDDLDLAPPGDAHLAAAALLTCGPPASPDPWRCDGWRPGGWAARALTVASGPGHGTSVLVSGTAGAAQVTIGDGDPVPASLHLDGTRGRLTLAGVTRPVHLALDGSTAWVALDGTTHALTVTGPLGARRVRARDDDGPGVPEARSPMPGTVVAVDVTDGDLVRTGQALLTVEAMKMEHRVLAPSDGIVTLTVRPADRVALDQVVATVTAEAHERTPA